MTVTVTVTEFRALWFLPLIVSIGCGYDVTRVDGGGLQLDYALAVVLDRAGAPLRVGAAFGVDAEGVSFGTPPSVVLEEGEDRAVLVGWNRAALADSWPGAELLPIDRARVVLSPPPQRAQIFYSGANREVRAPVPLAAKVLSLPELRDGERGFLDVLTLVLPLDPDPVPAGLEAYGAEHNLLEMDQIIRGVEMDTGFERLVKLDEDTLIVMSDSLLMWLDRGGRIDVSPYDPNGSNHTISTADIAARSSRFQDLALTLPDAGGARKVLVAGREGPDGTIWELDVLSDGLRFSRRVPITPDPRLPRIPALNRIVVGERGAAIAGGEEAVLLARRQDEDAFTVRLELREMFTADVTKAQGIIAMVSYLGITKNTAGGFPHLIGLESGTLFHGNVVAGNFVRLLDVAEHTDEPQDVHVLDAAFEGDEEGGAFEMWVAARYGHVFHRKKGGEFVRVEPSVSPELEVCATGARDRPFRFGTHFNAVRLSERHVHLLLVGCNALIRVRRADHSVTAVTRPGQRIEATEDDFCVMNGDGTSLWLGGERGGLMELRP